MEEVQAEEPAGKDEPEVFLTLDAYRIDATNACNEIQRGVNVVSRAADAFCSVLIETYLITREKEHVIALKSLVDETKSLFKSVLKVKNAGLDYEKAIAREFKKVSRDKEKATPEVNSAPVISANGEIDWELVKKEIVINSAKLGAISFEKLVDIILSIDEDVRKTGVNAQCRDANRKGIRHLNKPKDRALIMATGACTLDEDNKKLVKTIYDVMRGRHVA